VPRPKSAQPRFTLTQRNGVFYVRWWEDGGARRVSCRTAIHAEARRFLAEFLAARGTTPAPRLPTIGAILDGYEADRKAHVGPTLKYACAALRSVLGDLPPDLLTRERVRNYAKERRRKRPLSDGTIIRELVTLRAALRWAIGERWITQEPLVEVPPAPAPRDRWLTRPEAKRLADAAVAPHVRTFILLGLNTGARAGALLELTWDQIDLDTGRIALGRGRGNKRRAVVPITPELRAELLVAQDRAIGRYVVS
jgi:Phage integrase family